MSISVLVNGAFGKMGQLTVKTISEHPNLTLAGEIGRSHDLREAIIDSKAQVVIDFTHPDAVFNNTMTIIETGARPVIGTSGLVRHQIQQLQQQCTELKRGGIIVPNFSLGAVLMMKYAQQIVKYLPHVEIIEMHHDEKADSPSGTAIRTAELLEQAHKQVNQPDKPNRETVKGARGALHHQIPIHAVRLPGFLAHQQIIFGGRGETLVLRHDSINRECFMPGVCLACEKVMTLDRLVCGLEEIL